MAQIVISRETKAKLLAAAAGRGSIEPWMFQFTRCDKEFQTELVRTAEIAKNTSFFESLEEFLEQRKRQYMQLQIIAAEQRSRKDAAQLKAGRREEKDKRRQTKITRSPNYNPTGISFEEFLMQRGLYYPPNYRPPFVRFVSGGAVDSNRRRH